MRVNVKPRKRNAPRFTGNPSYACEACGKVVTWAEKKTVYSGKRHFLKRRFCSHACSTLGPSLKDRFWAKVESASAVECWEWRGNRNDLGYGRLIFRGRDLRAHRVSWELYHGRQVPEGLLVCHRCDNPPCVNPHHLFIGSNLDNVRDAVTKGRARGRCSSTRVA